VFREQNRVTETITRRERAGKQAGPAIARRGAGPNIEDAMKKLQDQIAKQTEATKALGDKKAQVTVNNKLTVDGREMAVAMASHTQEIQERAGFKQTPWNRRMLLEQGSAPVRS